MAVIYNFPVELHIKTITQDTPIEFFSSSGATENQDTINRYISNLNGNFFNLSLTVDTSLSNNNKITFLGKDTAIMQPRSVKFYVVKNGNQFLFYSVNTTNALEPFVNLYKYSYPFKYSYSYDGSNYYTSKEVRVGYGDYYSLNMSYTCFDISELIWYTPDHLGLPSYFQDAFYIYNEYNTGYISTVVSADTVRNAAIQQYSLNYGK